MSVSPRRANTVWNMKPLLLLQVLLSDTDMKLQTYGFHQNKVGGILSTSGT